MESKKIATCGVLCALSVVLMMAGSLIGIGTYAAPLLAFWLLLPVQQLYGNKAALTAFFAVAIISALVIPDRELSLFYCCFGWWPVAKKYVDRIPGKAARFAVKLVIYLAVILLMLAATMYVLGITELGEDLPVLFRVPLLRIPVTAIDAVLIPLGALLFFLCDSMTEHISARLTAQVRKIMRI